MESILSSLFPPQDFSLIAVILGMPLLGAFVNGVWGKQLGKSAVRLMALAAVGVSFVAAVVAFLALHTLVDKTKGTSGTAEHVKLVWSVWEWMHTNGRDGANVAIDLKFSIDALSGVMMLIVTGVGFLIHLYATTYMEKDKAYWRFFCYLNLFIFAMLVLILGDNLPVLFIGWEGVGLCSYLLIGFWYDVLPNAAAGKKAFIANRIGDFGLICGMFLLAHYCGALDWNGIASGASNLVSTADSAQVHLWPIGGGQFQGHLGFLQPSHPLTITAATAVGLMLLLGATGKSAQIPLYVWLPDAMAGPTPVSALIHAATMVTAGIYLVCRLSFVFVLSPFTMMVIACVGAATALFAATIALVQNDIKKVLAYSTVSQLGFMFLGVGVGAFTAGFFHVFTHAFFKACLFLGAGSVIHAMHARIHDDVKSQDIRFMGGLRKYMPLTYWTFFASTLAIAGCPLTSGFFSKDEILYRAFVNHTVNPFAERLTARHFPVFEPPMWIGPALYIVGVLAATMTAFYMFRLTFITFWGEFRGWTIGRPSLLAKHEAHDAHAGDAEHESEDGHHHHDDLTAPGYPPHESPWQMTVPLIILGAFAVFAGVLNMPIIHIGGHPFEPMTKWLEPVFESAIKEGVKYRESSEWAEHLEWPLALGGIAAFVVGSGVSYWMYVMKLGAPAKQLAEAQPALYRLVLDKWRIDELYDRTVLAAVDALADTAAAFDQSVVDGILARLSALVVAGLGTLLRAFQNGVVHVYAAMMVLGVAAIGWFFVAPHADATVTADGTNGDYVVLAAPGMGYTYQWDANGDGKPDKEGFGAETQVKLHLEPGATQTVRLGVKNAFGVQGAKEISVSRPAAKGLEIGQR
jgi:NADH-quinone oxidoreductase subunit L